MPKNAQTTAKLHSSHIASKVMIKIFQARLQWYMNRELPDVQARFRKDREPETKLPTSLGSSKKQESSRKTSALLTMLKPLTVWIRTNCGKFFKRWEYQTIWPASRETCVQVKKQQLELDMEQQTGSKSGKEYVKAVYCHTAYLIYMQSTSWEMLDWMKHKLESRLPREISITSEWHHPYGRKWRRTKEPLDESERGDWKSWVTTQYSEN